VGGLIGHCVPPPQPWTEIDAHVSDLKMRRLLMITPLAMTSWSCLVVAGQETAKQALQEIVILPALRPEVRLQCLELI